MDDEVSDSGGPGEDEAMQELANALQRFNWQEGVVDKAKAMLYSSNHEDNLRGVLRLKAMLCIGREEVYEVAQEVIDSGVVVRLVEFLRSSDRDLQWPAAFCLTNVAAGKDEQTDEVVRAGALPILLELTNSNDSRIRRQVIFCLANIAGSTPEHRKMLVSNPSYFAYLLQIGRTMSDFRLVTLICWNFRNVCLLGGPELHELAPALEYFLEDICRYWDDKNWISCTRFCFETLASLCRKQDSREWLLQHRYFEILLRGINNTRKLPPTSSETVLESLVWMLAPQLPINSELFIDEPISEFILSLVLHGHHGSAVQELALSAFAAVLRHPHGARQFEKFVTRVGAKDFLATLVALFYGTPVSPENLNPPTYTSRLLAAYVLAKTLLYCSTSTMKIYLTMQQPTIIEVLLELLDFTAANARMAAISPQECKDTVVGFTRTEFREDMASTVLELTGAIMRKGAEIQVEAQLPINPIAKLYADSDASARIDGSFRVITEYVGFCDLAARVISYLNS